MDIKSFRYKTKIKIRHLIEKYKILLPLYGYASILKTKKWKKLDDDTFFRKRYFENIGREPNLENPKTFNEKLLWLQMHDHNPLYTLLSDKYKVKEWVANRIGNEYVVPLLGVWNSVEDIPFDNLPEECVLKCNHDCGSVYIKHKGVPFNEKFIKRRFKKALQRNYYDVGRIWSYKNIIPKVFCEALIQTEDSKPPRDYKIFCFSGVPKFAFVASDRGENTKFDFFDIEWNRIPVKQHYPNSSYIINKPEQWDKMLELSKILSEGIPHVRIDFYIDKFDRILFGEFTFGHFSGKEPFEPDYYDEVFGRHLILSKE